MEIKSYSGDLVSLPDFVFSSCVNRLNVSCILLFAINIYTFGGISSQLTLL